MLQLQLVVRTSFRRSVLGITRPASLVEQRGPAFSGDKHLGDESSDSHRHSLLAAFCREALQSATHSRDPSTPCSGRRHGEGRRSTAARKPTKLASPYHTLLWVSTISSAAAVLRTNWKSLHRLSSEEMGCFHSSEVGTKPMKQRTPPMSNSRATVSSDSSYGRTALATRRAVGVENYGANHRPRHPRHPRQSPDADPSACNWNLCFSDMAVSGHIANG